MISRTNDILFLSVEFAWPEGNKLVSMRVSDEVSDESKCCLVSPRLHKWYNLLWRIWKLCYSYQIQPCTRPGHVFVSHSPDNQLQPAAFVSHLPGFLSWTIIQLFWRQFIMNEMIVNILAGSHVDGNRYDLYCWHRLIRVTQVLGLCFLACGLGQSWQTFDSFWKAKTMTSSFIFCCLKWSFNGWVKCNL